MVHACYLTGGYWQAQTSDFLADTHALATVLILKSRNKVKEVAFRASSSSKQQAINIFHQCKCFQNLFFQKTLRRDTENNLLLAGLNLKCRQNLNLGRLDIQLNSKNIFCFFLDQIAVVRNLQIVCKICIFNIQLWIL